MVFGSNGIEAYQQERFLCLFMERNYLFRKKASERHEFRENVIGNEEEIVSYVCVHCEKCREKVTNNFLATIYMDNKVPLLIEERELEQAETDTLTVMLWHLCGHPEGLEPLVAGNKVSVRWDRFVGISHTVTQHSSGHFIRVASEGEGLVALTDPISETGKFSMEETMKGSLLEFVPPSTSGTNFTRVVATNSSDDGEDQIRYRHVKMGLFPRRPSFVNTCGIVSSLYVWKSFVTHIKRMRDANSAALQDLFKKRIEDFRKCETGETFRLVFLHVFCELALFENFFSEETEEIVKKLQENVKRVISDWGIDGECRNEMGVCIK